MKEFFTTLPGNIIHCFRIHNLPWHFLALALTLVAVTTGFDWGYFLLTRSDLVWEIAFPAVLVGAFMPILLPLSLIIAGTALKNTLVRMTGWAIGQAAFVGWFISSTYKAFSGRIPPLMHGAIGDNISNGFQLGFWRGGIFWGWPSSHTAVAFAVAVAFLVMFPKHKYAGIAVLVYSLYVGLGVSVTVHWFSDFLAGMIIGSICGYVVGINWKKYIHA